MAFRNHLKRILPSVFYAAVCLLLLSGSQRADAATVLNLRDYGATGDGATDDGPALQRALDALAAQGGGTLLVPAGRYVIATRVAKDFTGLASSVTISGVESPTPAPSVTDSGYVQSAGLNLVSEFRPRTGTQFTIGIVGLEDFLIHDIAFVGTPDVAIDSLTSLALNTIGEAVIRHCEFYGLSSHVAGGSIVAALRSKLRIEQSVFLGCATSSGYYSPLVMNTEWKGIHVSDTTFLDYGQRPEIFSKMGFGAPYGWVNIGNAAPPTPDSPRREAVFRNVFFDEGGYVGLASLPYLYQPPSAPIDLVYVTGLRMNVSNLKTTGHYIYGPRRVLIERSFYGWSHNADSALRFLNAGRVILDEIECVAHADRIHAESSVESLHVINSTYTTLDSLAPETKVINTATADEDPVQHVRSRFESLLARAPDPAAHFYWSDRMLRCGTDASCVTSARAALAAYLDSAPAETFAVAGRVTDKTGAALAGVSVALTGSQTVADVTDSEGRYRFSNLPTSGDYLVTPAAPPDHRLDPAPVEINTPAGDRTADFTVAPVGNTISGRVTNGGSPVAGVTLTLTGSQGGTATTDADGHYSFADLPASGSYTVSPSKAHYTFAPSSRSFGNLNSDQTADFAATLNNYTISGRVIQGGAGLAGISISLTGAQTGAAVTDAGGRYSFRVPALGDYTLTPSGNYSFQPPQRAYNNLSANFADADFTAAVPTNLALGRPATQSSTGYGGVASRATDGNTDGDWSHNSVTATFADARPWWQVDLGASRQIDSIKVWNRTDCCSNRLSNFYVLVSDAPMTTDDLQAQLSRADVFSYHFPGAAGRPTQFAVGHTGRYVRVQLANPNNLSLAEVEVIGQPLNPAQAVNFALGREATQQTTGFGGTAARAVDGDTDGDWSHNSVTATLASNQAWWQVDLGASRQLNSVKLWNRTDCCSERLSNFYVLVSDTPFLSNDLAAARAQQGVSSFHTAGQAGRPTTVNVNRTGRYVRVQLVGTNYLSLAEVEVWGSPTIAQPVNVALGMAATQSSTLVYSAPTDASRAVDGNTSGNLLHGSTAHTNSDAQAWWQVDLGASRQLSKIQIYGRTDCCSERLSNFYIFISDSPFTSQDLSATLAQPGVTSYHVPGGIHIAHGQLLNRTGRYVRVQLAGTNYLGLAEVQVLGQ